MNIPTPHISAKKGDFAKTVIMPGDPYRAKFIAEKYLTDYTIVTDVRGIQGYTGFYKGKKISVMASGMGCPSIGIYSYELFVGYDVDNIIRVGTCGAFSEKLKINDIVVAMGACYDSGFYNQFRLHGVFSPVCDFNLLEKTSETAKELGLKINVGNVFTSDSFYGESHPDNKKWGELGVLASEMESAALYMNAAQTGKKALTMLTVADHLFKEGGMTSDEREKSLNDMIKLSLETAIKL